MLWFHLYVRNLLMNYLYDKLIYCLMWCYCVHIYLLDSFQAYYFSPSEVCYQARYPVNSIISSKAVALSIINAYYLLDFLGTIICYFVWVGTGGRILYLYFILLLSCAKIWTHIIITNKINYVSLLLFWSWFISGYTVLTHIIITRYRQNSTWFYYSWWQRKFFT